MPAELRETLAAIATHYPNPRPSVQRLADMLGVTPRTVSRRLRELERLWLLETTHTGRRETRRAHRRIILPGLELPAVPRSTVPNRRCEACREWIEPKRADARYCSQACRQRAYRARNDGRVPVTEAGNGGHLAVTRAPNDGHLAVTNRHG